MDYSLQALSDQLDEQNAALEAMLNDLDDMDDELIDEDLAMESDFFDDDEMDPAEESLFHKPKSVEKMLAKVQKQVNKKCKTAEDCDDMLASLKAEQDKFNSAMTSMKQAAAQFKEDGDKKALSNTIKPIVSNLKKSCDLLNLKDITDNNKNITDDDIQKLHDFIAGATKIVKDRKSSLGQAKEGYDNMSFDMYMDDFDYAYEADGAAEQKTGLLTKLKNGLRNLWNKMTTWVNEKLRKEKDPNKKGIFAKFKSWLSSRKSKVENASTPEEVTSISEEMTTEKKKVEQAALGNGKGVEEMIEKKKKEFMASGQSEEIALQNAKNWVAGAQTGKKKGVSVTDGMKINKRNQDAKNNAEKMTDEQREAAKQAKWAKKAAQGKANLEKSQQVPLVLQHDSEYQNIQNQINQLKGTSGKDYQIPGTQANKKLRRLVKQLNDRRDVLMGSTKKANASMIGLGHAYVNARGKLAVATESMTLFGSDYSFELAVEQAIVDLFDDLCAYYALESNTMENSFAIESYDDSDDFESFAYESYMDSLYGINVSALAMESYDDDDGYLDELDDEDFAEESILSSVEGTNLKRSLRMTFGEESRATRKTYQAAKKAERKKNYEAALGLYKEAKKGFQKLLAKAKSFPDNTQMIKNSQYLGQRQSLGKVNSLEWTTAMINKCDDAIDRINNKKMRGDRKASTKAARAAKKAAKESYGYYDDDDDFAMESYDDDDYLDDLDELYDPEY